jgi:hypothetical protein
LKLKGTFLRWLRAVADAPPGSEVLARRRRSGTDAVDTAISWLHGSPGASGNLAAATATVDLAELGLQRLMDALQDEARLAGVRGRILTERNRRVVSALRPYFGDYPATLLERSPGEKSAFRLAAGQLAETLLGRKSASAVLLRIDSDLEAA